MFLRSVKKRFESNYGRLIYTTWNMTDNDGIIFYEYGVKNFVFNLKELKALFQMTRNAIQR